MNLIELIGISLMSLALLISIGLSIYFLFMMFIYSIKDILKGNLNLETLVVFSFSAGFIGIILEIIGRIL